MFGHLVLPTDLLDQLKVLIHVLYLLLDDLTCVLEHILFGLERVKALIDSHLHLVRHIVEDS